MAKKFQRSFIVCKCRNVSLGEVIFSIEHKGAKTIEEIGNLTDAGTACKSCQCSAKDKGEEKLELYLDEILKKFLG
ncbi:MAG: (2Fe-2S)-binding protein [Arcobacter sp.]|nr:(2Fe-2S)-binding protein [Arcobacter sp.]